MVHLHEPGRSVRGQPSRSAQGGRDQSRTFVGIYLHESRLYILEATVPARAPQPGLFQQSLSFLDASGKKVRYPSIYYNRLNPIKNAFGPEAPR